MFIWCALCWAPRARVGSTAQRRPHGSKSWGYKSTVPKNVVTNRDGVLYSTPLQKLLLAMARMRGDVGRAAAAAAAAELGLPADLEMPPPAGFEQLPAAVQKMWCNARDNDEFREQAGAVVAAYNKAMEAGALQSTAERAAAALAYKIDPGYREYMEHEKKWQLERRAAAAKLEGLATKARRLLKKARKLVSCSTICESLLNKKQAMDFADAIRYEVHCVRELIVQLDMEARLPLSLCQSAVVLDVIGLGARRAREVELVLWIGRWRRAADARALGLLADFTAARAQVRHECERDRLPGDLIDRAVGEAVAELAEAREVLRVADELAQRDPLLEQRARAAVANRPDRELEAAHRRSRKNLLTYAMSMTMHGFGRTSAASSISSSLYGLPSTSGGQMPVCTS